MPGHRAEADRLLPFPANQSCHSFVAAVKSFVADADEIGLRRYLQLNWNLSSLTRLIHGDEVESARTAAYCLGVVGGEAGVLTLTGALSHDDPGVAAAAEDALWRSWFNAAGAGARRHVTDAVELMAEERYDAAVATLDGVIEQHPRFPEAYHQRGLARHLMGDGRGAIDDFQKASELNPCHFAAHAGMGRSYADSGRYGEALASLRRALRIHPRFDGVRQSIRLIHEARGFAAPVHSDD
ncbi:MAG: tetratricopeptide repeat protein [Phycisphaerales bacterium]|nr:tetratricopeptide repeat protein [Phycisphaerales bacterium]